MAMKTDAAWPVVRVREAIEDTFMAGQASERRGDSVRV